ncbi:hypothetical protein FKZ61_005650 [Litorilinea aerophila]|uniref:Uncharacterized protein n=1 Tax=Litorilinea aerophila TaxID=1204385 RepID=A0A540VIY5_9CHLR|nr:hypothetical protein [Litorilinea aerophila]MCC9075595.1 hypothetical protein [Litorilinea aerophila]GIV79200.1 MAG: hypothetical protein KatS3mg050_3594 [Litorilinea sp.]
MRQSHTAVVARNEEWQGEFALEPYEAAWATEALYFVRALAASGPLADATARVQISPDGIHWCDEGTQLPLPSQEEELTFCRVRHFGGWLRAVGTLPDGARLKVMVYLVLKE